MVRNVGFMNWFSSRVAAHNLHPVHIDTSGGGRRIGKRLIRSVN